MTHPRRYSEHDPRIERLRAICLALPETTEKEAWGECTFRVGGKMFAMTDNNHHDSGHIAVWCKAPAMAQEVLVKSDPARFFRPPYVGHNGWVGVRLDVKVDWKELAAILRDGYQMAAPKRLLSARPAVELGAQSARSTTKSRKQAEPSAAKLSRR